MSCGGTQLRIKLIVEGVLLLVICNVGRSIDNGNDDLSVVVEKASMNKRSLMGSQLIREWRAVLSRASASLLCHLPLGGPLQRKTWLPAEHSPLSVQQTSQRPAKVML